MRGEDERMRGEEKREERSRPGLHAAYLYLSGPAWLGREISRESASLEALG